MRLYDFRFIKIDDLSNNILTILNTPKTYQELLNTLIDETIYLESDIYHVLKKLEEIKDIIIIRVPPITKIGKKRTSIQLQDLIKKI